MEKNITFSDKIVLRADQNSFSFRISALGYQAPGMNKLMYKLEGFDNEWLSIGESPLITYANLRYGDYVFRVKAANDNGVWNNNEISLSIRILSSFLSVNLGLLHLYTFDYWMFRLFDSLFKTP